MNVINQWQSMSVDACMKDGPVAWKEARNELKVGVGLHQNNEKFMAQIKIL